VAQGTVRLLFVGDIFGHAGRMIVADHLQDIRRSQGVDVVIANVENSAAGFGVTPAIAEELFRYGIDVMTTGNHVWDKKEIFDYLPRQPKLLRPANYPASAVGSGLYIHTTESGVRCAIMNLQGRVHMPNTDCPFRKADQLLESIRPDCKVRFIDFHAEVTSEKVAMGWYLDGRVSAVIGTHTHIPTADTRILPGGTGYQTDCGMTGPYESVIGSERDLALRRFLTGISTKLEPAKGQPELHSVIIDVDVATGKTVAIRRHTVQGG
jgi:metallophosphoesterase (TIGR00282 family)